MQEAKGVYQRKELNSVDNIVKLEAWKALREAPAEGGEEGLASGSQVAA